MGSGQVNYADAVEIANKLIDTFSEDTSIDKVFVVFTEFKTVLSQKPVVEQLLPIPKTMVEEGENAGAQAEYIYEQTPAEIFGRLLPKQVITQIYKGMLESVASEQGSRMTAMDSASKNAGEPGLFEERGRVDQLAHSQHEPYSTGRDHEGDHRGRFGCRCRLKTLKSRDSPRSSHRDAGLFFCSLLGYALLAFPQSRRI